METEELVQTLNEKLRLTPRRIPIHHERRRSDEYDTLSRKMDQSELHVSSSLKSSKSFLIDNDDDLDQSDDELLSLTKQKKPRTPEFSKRSPVQRPSSSSYDDEDRMSLGSVNRKNMKRSRSELIFYKGLPEGKARVSHYNVFMTFGGRIKHGIGKFEIGTIRSFLGCQKRSKAYRYRT